MPTIPPALVPLAALVVLTSAAPVVAAPPEACWRPPVEAPVTDPFRRPDCRWCAGNRGVEFGTRAGEPVRAVATGRVTFSGMVAGRRYVVVLDAAGRRVTYGDLGLPVPSTGAVVVAGSVVGVTTGPLHLGVRVGDEYLDPADFLGTPAIRPYLVPVDGRPGRPSVVTVHCGAGRGAG